jgi:hypothetical protein
MGGANILFLCSLSESCTLGFRSGGAARLKRGDPRFTRDVAMFDAPGGIVMRRSPAWVVTAQRKSWGPRQS